MCGIAGVVNLDGAPIDRPAIGGMTDAVQHRGPDDRHVEDCELARMTVGIGFQRLKILDLTDQARQPMWNADRTVLLAFNGEIYNAFDYLAELKAAGFRFRSRSDTEVILYLYEHYGLDGLLERLNGMFALVIADRRAGEIHVVRDHLGIKPMYWTQAGNTVLFASEAKAFHAHPAFRTELATEHVDELLAFRYVAGAPTLLRGVSQLRPGHRLRITAGGVSEHRYWAIPDGVEKRALSRADGVEELAALLGESVRSQLLSDVKLGCQLSGGIDSSLITVLARSHVSADMDTFSVVFDDPAFSEDRWISTAAAAARADSHRFMFSESSFLDHLEAASWHMDQPISHPNSLGIWLLARKSRPQVTVLLSGEGADEVFGGYTRFYYAHLRPRLGKAGRGLTWVPSVGRRLGPHFQGDPVEAFVMASVFQPAGTLRQIRPDADLSPALARRAAIFNEGASDHLSNCLKYEMQTYMVDLLVRQDKMTMAHGLENRVPFLDRRVVEFARRLPADHLVGRQLPTAAGRMRGTKVIVKDLARRTFDEAFVYRRKSGFALPLAQYFRSATFAAMMEDRLLPGMQARGLVEVEAVRRLWHRAQSAPSATEPFWTVVSLELWAQQMVDGRGRR